MRRQREGKGGGGAGAGGGSSRSRPPGKRTRSQQIVRARKSRGGHGASGKAEAAAPGDAFDAAVAGSGGDVPHRPEMESAFGEDFSGVRAHAGEPAVRDAGAMALTDGRSIAFSDSSPDRATVAHELAHVVQQRRSGDHGVAARSLSEPDDPAEREAEAAAQSVVRGQTPDIRQTSRAGLFGDWLGDAADWVEDRIGDALDSRPDEARRDAEEELQAFMSTTYETDNFHPSTGRGLFDARYDPVGGLLTIISNIHIKFTDGNPNSPEWQSQGQGNHQPAAFQWQDDEKEAYAENLIETVRQVWEGQHVFHLERPFWEALPNVRVNLDIQQVDAGEGHYDIEIHKWPESIVGAVVSKPGGHDHSTAEWHESAEGGIENPDVRDRVRSTSTRNAYASADNDNPGQILFDQGSSAIKAPDRTQLETFGQTLGRDDMPPFDVSITGHASSEGDEEDNMRLSEDRAREVNNVVVASGAKRQPTVRGVGESGATEDPVWRRVDIDVGTFEPSQHSVAHEYGHILGLGDEYPRKDDGGSRQVGDEVAHSDLAEEFDLTEHPVVAHHSEGIMSNGEVVNPWHYATFMEVLAEMTDTRGEWGIGPGSGPRRGMGDFPTGSRGGGGTALG